MKIKLFIYILFAALIISCGKKEVTENKSESINNTLTEETNKTKITFVELGSVNCIPCKQMQPIMKAIEEKYGDQVKVVFYDVWKENQKKYATQYGIKLIPTQVFLDANGKDTRLSHLPRKERRRLAAEGRKLAEKYGQILLAF